MKDILRSLGILIFVSSCFAWFLSEFNISFWGSFAFVTSIQIIAWNLYKYYQQSQIIARTQEIDKIAMEQIGKQQAMVPCASCKADQLVDIELNTANQFECVACDQKNSVYINIETVAKTIINDK